MDEGQKTSSGKLFLNAKVYLPNLSAILKQPHMFILCSSTEKLINPCLASSEAHGSYGNATVLW